MNKVTLREALIAEQEQVINELNEKINYTHSMVDIDESDTIDPEDRSHQYESGEMEQLIRTQLQKAKIDLEHLRSIDFDAKSKVEAGAFVQTEKFNFVIGFPVVPFDLEGMHIVGVSEASPIFPFMSGKTTGDSFEFGGKTYTIKAIY
ncbi:MAG: hypothetical protein EP333_03690 [Bacteroidetes bacterium]|nr:MAG: hypothetical protein EP333_03690 [Bacteroidota bacterium]